MIKAAIVGMGFWGQRLVNSVQESSHIRFVAGWTRTPAKAAEFAQRHNLRMFETYQQLLADPGIDAVVLATPHSTHAEQIVAAAAAGKHVFSEKPLTLDLASARRAAQACRDRGVTLAVGYNWRFQPALQEIRRMIDDGRLGRVLHIEGNFCGPSNYRLAQDFGADDTTSMLMRFAGGATAYLATVIATAETWRMQVFGSKGWAEVGDVEHLKTWNLKVCTIGDDVWVKQKPVQMTFPEVSTERAELENFAAAAEKRQALVTPESDAVHNAAVLEAILASASTYTTVRIG
ncbi:MAG: Gfo/Idh/MocA family oxidoreductase [Candidatus Korobacteraceae bacterium]